MSEQPNLFPLKLIVISFIFVLLGGAVWVFFTIAAKAKAEFPLTEACGDTTIHLKNKGSITSVIAQGRTVQITLAEPQKTSLITVDRCNGTILHTLTITP